MANLEGLASVDLFRCDCRDRLRPFPSRRCDYRRADWPLVLKVAIEEFRAAFGLTAVDLDTACDVVLPRVEERLSPHRLSRELGFAISMFAEPMLADRDQWTNGQHRCQAAIDAGCSQALFVD